MAHGRRPAAGEQATRDVAATAEELAAELEQVKAELAAIRASTSWRLTAPLRAAVDAIRGTGGKVPPRSGRVTASAQALAQPSSAAAIDTAPPSEAAVHERFRSRAEWAAWAEHHPHTVSREAANRIVESALSRGISSAFLGKIAAGEVALRGTDPREGLVARDLNSRQRAVLEIFSSYARAHDLYGCRIYAHEGLTAFALTMRGRYPLFLGSEYASDAETARRLWPIPAVDITRSDFEDATFDFVLSNEVFEHVPDLPAALRDTARILKPGGALIATFPFYWNNDETSVRARLVDGRIEHLATPEYHGNPVDPEGGSLVFQIPGWDILAECQRAGFTDAWMSLFSSAPAGVTAGDMAGIFVLEAVR